MKIAQNWNRAGLLPEATTPTQSSEVISSSRVQEWGVPEEDAKGRWSCSIEMDEEDYEDGGEVAVEGILKSINGLDLCHQLQSQI